MKDHSNDSYQITFDTYDKVAQAYNDKFMDLDIYNATYDTFCNMIVAGASVLDIGCGPGNITHYLLSKRPDLKIEGIDAAPAMISLANANNPDATFEVMDCRRIDQLRKKFDGIVCGFCIPYLSAEDCVKMVGDIADLLYDGGVFYLSFVEGDYEKSGYQTSKAGAIYFYYHSAEYLRELLALNGFEPEHVNYINYPKPDGSAEIHTVIIARKNTV